jgi:hypothetical protein
LEFIRHLIQVGAFIPPKADQISTVGHLLCRSSENAALAAVIEQADRKREMHFARIREFQYVNISIEAGTMHSLAAAHCMLPNLFHLQDPIFFDTHESQG